MTNKGFLVQNRIGVNRVNTLFYRYKHRIQIDTVGEIQVTEIIYILQRLVDRCDRMFIARLIEQSQPFLEPISEMLFAPRIDDSGPGFALKASPRQAADPA